VVIESAENGGKTWDLVDDRDNLQEFLRRRASGEVDLVGGSRGQRKGRVDSSSWKHPGPRTVQFLREAFFKLKSRSQTVCVDRLMEHLLTDTRTPDFLFYILRPIERGQPLTWTELRLKLGIGRGVCCAPADSRSLAIAD